MKLKIELPSETAIAREMSKALISDVDIWMRKAVIFFKREIPPIIREHIESSPEYISILNGQLKYSFGIANPQEKLTGLLDIWMNSIDVQYTRPTINGRGQVKASITVSMMKVDFSDVLYSEYASVYDQERGYVLPWLEWLVLEGNRVIVKDSKIVFGPNPRSRTGGAVMQKDTKSKWKVPSTYSGTIGNNWITRAIDEASGDLETLFDRAIR